MAKIPTTGLYGLMNRINLFSTTMQKEVVDVVVHMNDVPINTIAANRVMLTSRTESLIFTGKDLSPNDFLNLLSNSGGNEIDMKEYDSVKELYRPEYNTGTNKIGKGSRRIGNIVMLIARADFHIRNGHDLFLYEFHQMLVNNSVMKEDI